MNASETTPSPATSLDPSERSGRYEKATFAAGCFWGVEAAFRRVAGVVNARAGYIGGTAIGPTYEQVCTGGTGHAEAVEVTFDPQQVRYEDLLEVFWDIHDPTTRNRQGPDVGNQYRSAIFVHTPAQQQAAEASKQRLQSRGRLKGKIVTSIDVAGPFYEAEPYHQQYLAKRGETACQAT